MLTTQETTKKYGVPNITGAGYLEPLFCIPKILKNESNSQQNTLIPK